MGKIRTRIIGDETVEKEQKAEQKQRSGEKKILRKARTIAEPDTASPTPPSLPKTPNRPKTPKTKPRGKKYKEAKALVDKTKSYLLEEGIELLKKMKLSKFDESIELHLNVDETGLKGELDLPHSTGKIVKVTVVDDTVLTNIEKGKIDFDILVTHPSYMPKLAKFAKVLGPKGLMPNPKAGTISTTPEEVVKKFSKGILRWKTEPKFPLIHQMIGKLSLEPKAIAENARKFLSAVGKIHVKKAFIKSTMSPSLKLDLEKV